MNWKHGFFDMPTAILARMSLWMMLVVCFAASVRAGPETGAPTPPEVAPPPIAGQAPPPPMLSPSPSPSQPSFQPPTFAPGSFPRPPEQPFPQKLAQKISLGDLLATVIYGLIGIFLSILSYKLFGYSLPFDINKEIEVDQNIALGMVVASMCLGCSMIIAAAIMS